MIHLALQARQFWQPQMRVLMRWTLQWMHFRAAHHSPVWVSIVEALRNTDRDTGLDIERIREISAYWEQVRAQYTAFESGLAAPASEVYLHEMPGGQFTNLKAQARSLGLEERWGGCCKNLRRCEPNVWRYCKG